MQLFWWFSYKPTEKYWAISPKRKHQLFKMTLSTFENCLFELCFAFFLVVTKKYVLRTSWGISARSCTCFLFKCRVAFHLRYFSNVTFATLALSFCVWDVLRYRILKKTAFVSWAKQKLSKTTLSTFQKCLCELWWACCFGCNWKSCFENFLRSLHLEQYVFFVQMQSHASAALVFEGYVGYFCSLHLASEMSCDIEYL